MRFAIGSGKALLSRDDFLAVIHVIYVAHRERGGGAAPAPPSPGSLSRVRVWQCFAVFLVCLKGLAFRKRDRARRRRSALNPKPRQAVLVTDCDSSAAGARVQPDTVAAVRRDQHWRPGVAGAGAVAGPDRPTDADVSCRW